MSYMALNIVGKEGSAWWLSLEALWSGWSVSVSSLKLRRREKRWGRRKFRNRNLIPVQRNAIPVNIIGIENEERINEVKGVSRVRNRKQGEGQATGKK